jgi:hypothetical protein
VSRDWDDDGDRVSIVINPPRSLLPPALTPSAPVPRWAASIALALAGLLGLVKLVIDVIK